jgi:hypothetical protein
VLPALVALLLSPFLPESVRFLARKSSPSQRELIRKCFDRMAAWHKVSLAGIDLVVPSEGKSESFALHMMRIFVPRQMAVKTMSLFGLWFFSSFGNYFSHSRVVFANQQFKCIMVLCCSVPFILRIFLCLRLFSLCSLRSPKFPFLLEEESSV